MIPETAFTQALLGGVIFCIVLGVAGGRLTKLGPWYYALRQPSWKPPDWAFGLIWTFVFICLTLATAYAWDAASLGQRTAMIWSLAINGILNVAWSGIFFFMQKPALAFIELVIFWFSIVVLVFVLGSASGTAAVLLLPYLLWVTIAGVLNFQIVRMNKA
jgi:translocator protein